MKKLNTTENIRVKAAKSSVSKIKEQLKPVHIIFILDRSSSMNSMKSEAISGFNTFLQGQKDLPGKATFSLVFFDTDIMLIYDNADIKKIPNLNDNTYKPNGMTALYDAIGFTVDRYKNRKSVKTIVAILTDGDENASKTYMPLDVQNILKTVQTEGEWEVLFLGANLDSKKFANVAGIKLNNTTNYEYTSKGMFDAINTANYATSMMRGATLNVGGNVIDKSIKMDDLYNIVKNNSVINVVDSTT